MLNDGENLLPPSVRITYDSMIRNIDNVEHAAPATRPPASFFFPPHLKLAQRV